MFTYQQDFRGSNTYWVAFEGQVIGRARRIGKNYWLGVAPSEADAETREECAMQLLDEATK
jgi:hypothetical protein